MKIAIATILVPIIFFGVYKYIDIEKSIVKLDNNQNQPVPSPLAEKNNPPAFQEKSSREEIIIKRGSTVYASLKKVVPVEDLEAVIATARPTVNLARIKAGTRFAVTKTGHTDPEITKIELLRSRREKVVFTKADELTWQTKVVTLPIEKRLKKFSGKIHFSLWETAANIGMDADLISKFAEIFAWQLDFSREVRKWDQIRLVVEELFVSGRHYGWGNILVAEYQNSQESILGIRYPWDSKKACYYNPSGASLKRMFLKGPLKFGRITSRFSKKRFHPILKKHRPHYGVDYGAPRGTPILAVGKGRVAYAGWKGSSGIMVKIRHNSIYTTAYLHMSKVAKGVRKGKVVEQGQVIGYVGSTGLATAPHLHFSFYEHGRYVDPLGRKFPSKDPVPPEHLATYKKYARDALALLPQWQKDVSSPIVARGNGTGEGEVAR